MYASHQQLYCFTCIRHESSTCKIMYSELIKLCVLHTLICLNCNKCVTTDLTPTPYVNKRNN